MQEVRALSTPFFKVFLEGVLVMILQDPFGHTAAKAPQFYDLLPFAAVVAAASTNLVNSLWGRLLEFAWNLDIRKKGTVFVARSFLFCVADCED